MNFQKSSILTPLICALLVTIAPAGSGDFSIVDGKLTIGEWSPQTGVIKGIHSSGNQFAFATMERGRSDFRLMMEIPALHAVPADLSVQLAFHKEFPVMTNTRQRNEKTTRRLCSIGPDTAGSVGFSHETPAAGNIQRKPGLYNIDPAIPAGEAYTFLDSTPVWLSHHVIIEILIPQISLEFGAKETGTLWVWITSESEGLQCQGTIPILPVRAAPKEAQDINAEGIRRINEDGSMTIDFADGMQKHVSANRRLTTTTYADGRRTASGSLPLEAQRPRIPPPPAGGPMHGFLDSLAESELQVIRWLVSGDEESVLYYLKTEKGLDIYDIIIRRQNAIRIMTRSLSR